MRRLAALALLALLTTACGEDNGDSEAGDGLPDWAPEASMARTPGGATMLWHSEMDESGESGTLSWAVYATDGTQVAHDSEPIGPWRVSAYDGGFLVVRGDEMPYAPMTLLDEETGASTEPVVQEESRLVRAGDLAVSRVGTWAFRPSDGSVAPFPEPPAAAFGSDADSGGMLPTAIDADGALTVLEARISNPRDLYRSTDGGRTWDVESVRLPRGTDLAADEIFASGSVTALTLLHDGSPSGVLVYSDGWRVAEFNLSLDDHWVSGLADGRVLVVPRDGLDRPAYIGDDVVPTRLVEVEAEQLRPLTDGLASMSPEPRVSRDGGQTWEALALGS